MYISVHCMYVSVFGPRPQIPVVSLRCGVYQSVPSRENRSQRAALGREFVDAGPVWSASVSDPDATRPNVISIYKRLSSRIEEFRARIEEAAGCSEEDLRIYEESVHYLLY